MTEIRAPERRGVSGIPETPMLITLGTKRTAIRPIGGESKEQENQLKRSRLGYGSHVGRSKSEKMIPEENKVPLKEIGERVKDRAWVARVKKSFVRKFYSPATLATKNAKRKKVLEVLNELDTDPFPLEVETLLPLAAVLDATGMKAGDQYLSEAKALHVEPGFEWSLQLDQS